MQQDPILDIYTGFYFAEISPASVLLMAKEQNESDEFIDKLYKFFLDEGYSKETLDNSIEEMMDDD